MTPPRKREDKAGHDSGDRPGGDQKWPNPEGPPLDELLRGYRFRPRRDHGDKTRYTPFIVLRHGAGDTGARPLAPGTNFWNSPDVFVVSSAGANVPVAGEPNRMFARVNNWGIKDAAGVIVRYWWCNPSLAITELNAHLIGTAQAFVPSNYSVVVECPTPWIPIIENGGHECVFAEAWVPFFDPIAAPLDPVSDRHVCQRNLHVIEVAQGAPFSFDMEVANLVGMQARVTIHVEAMSARVAAARLTAPDIAFKRPLVVRSGTLPLSLDVSDAATLVVSPNQTFPRRQMGLAKQAAQHERPLDHRSLGTTVRTISFGPWETRTLTVSGRLPRDAARGQVFGFDVSERIEDTITGGYTLYVVAGG